MGKAIANSVAREKELRGQSAKGKKGNGAKKRGGGKSLMVLPLVAGLLVVALPTMIVVGVGIVPTLAARITDLTPGRYATRCVGALNMAGIAPFLRKLWGGENDLATAMQMIADPYTWLIAYGAAGIGWLLFMSVPNAIAMFKAIETEILVKRLRSRQEELVGEWGPTIVTRARDSARKRR